MSNEVGFFQKMSNLRTILNEQDWTMDGWNDKQGYPFLSHQKMKSNVSKAMVQAGLEWTLDYTEWSKEPEIGMMKQHYIVKAHATIYDTSSDKFVTIDAFGEGADSGDKAMSKAQTNAFKSIISNNFMVAEIGADGEGVEASNDTIKTDARSGYEAKQEIAKAKTIRQNATSEPTPVVNAEGAVSETQKKVLSKILDKVKILDEGVLQQFGSRDQIETDYYSVKTAEDALRFITAYQGVLKCQ